MRVFLPNTKACLLVVSVILCGRLLNIEAVTRNDEDKCSVKIKDTPLKLTLDEFEDWILLNSGSSVVVSMNCFVRLRVYRSSTKAEADLIFYKRMKKKVYPIVTLNSVDNLALNKSTDLKDAECFNRKKDKIFPVDDKIIPKPRKKPVKCLVSMLHEIYNFGQLSIDSKETIEDDKSDAYNEIIIDTRFEFPEEMSGGKAADKLFIKPTIPTGEQIYIQFQLEQAPTEGLLGAGKRRGKRHVPP